MLDSSAVAALYNLRTALIGMFRSRGTVGAALGAITVRSPERGVLT